MSIKFVSDEKVAETSSKGNQEKWKYEGRWYKLDQFGYEGLAETVTYYSERDRGFIAMRVVRTVLLRQKESGRLLPPA